MASEMKDLITLLKQQIDLQQQQIAAQQEQNKKDEHRHKEEMAKQKDEMAKQQELFKAVLKQCGSSVTTATPSFAQFDSMPASVKLLL